LEKNKLTIPLLTITNSFLKTQEIRIKIKP
jgi:hypothetical protein